MKKIHVDMLMTKEEKAQTVSDAHRHEMNLSQYIRWLIEKERKHPTVHAHWVEVEGENEGDVHNCSHCGQPSDWRYPYCHYCNATMDEEADE